MAFQAKRAHIGKVALPAAFHNGYEMIGIPQAFSGAQVPLDGNAEASGSAQTAKMRISGNTVDTAKSANAAIPFEHFFSKVARVSAKLPLVYAPIGAERGAAGGNLQMAPSAEISPVQTLFEFLALNPTTGHCTLRAHKSRVEQACRLYRSSAAPLPTRLRSRGQRELPFGRMAALVGRFPPVHPWQQY